MNIELNPASALPVSEAAKTAGAENTSGSDFLDTLIKVAQENLPAEEPESDPLFPFVEIKISALFDRSSGFFNFSDALVKAPRLNFLDIVFPDTLSLDIPVSFSGVPFFNLFGI